jgi:uncharacterized protein (DUF302 family)
MAGVMFPCNVVVWEGDDGKAHLAAFARAGLGDLVQTAVGGIQSS